MSRIGRKPIPVPAGVTVTIEPELVKVAGPKGELSERINRDMTVTQDGDTLTVSPGTRADVTAPIDRRSGVAPAVQYRRA